MSVPAEYLPAIRRYGRTVDTLARTRYGISGDALLAKLLQGESGFQMNRVSSAGARGASQFTPGSRQIAIQRYGIDPWANPDAAVHAASLHLRGKINGQVGLEGYNPGDSSYTGYILGQKVGNVAGQAGDASSGGTGTGGTPGTPGSMTPGTAGVPQATITPGADTTGLLQQLLSQPAQRVPSPIALPSFSASQYVPNARTMTGNQTPLQVPYGSTQTPPVSTSALIDALSQTGTTAPSINTVGGTSGSATPGTAGTGGVGGALVQEATQRANTIDAKHLPYLWGGGHAGKVNPANTGPLDCSGAVAAVLGINPRVSGQFETFGSPGAAPGGRGITIYANSKHVLMEINGHFFGTSRSNPGGGAGWIPRDQISPSYLQGFTARHVAQ